MVIACPDCGGEARRVPEVIDVWFDSGAMPFAQFGAPLAESRGSSSRSYPAQFICEAIDQTRGWFYSLMTVGTLVFGQSAYENVVCLGLLVDERGRKMSKHLGNVLEPMQLMEAHGADAVRWFFAVSGSPWATRKSGRGSWRRSSARSCSPTGTRRRSWSCTPMRRKQSAAPVSAPAPAAAASRSTGGCSASCNLVVREVTAALEAFDPATAGRRLAGFIDDISNWYVRRSRRRFWDGPATPDGAAAFATLSQALDTLTRLMAPITPFITDYIWGVLREDDAPESVHLATWPTADDSLIDTELAAQMALVRRLVELGRSARASAVVKVRQPLARALVAAPGFAGLPPELRAQIADELNVRAHRAARCFRRLAGATHGEGEFPCARQAIRQRHPGCSRCHRDRRPGRAGRSAAGY